MIIHKHILGKIPFFRACLENPFRESGRGEIEMPEEDPKIMTYLIYYAYHSQLNPDLDLLKIARLAAGNRVYTGFAQRKLGRLIRLCILAHKFGMEALENLIGDVIRCSSEFVLFRAADSEIWMKAYYLRTPCGKLLSISSRMRSKRQVLIVGKRGRALVATGMCTTISSAAISRSLRSSRMQLCSIEPTFDRGLSNTTVWPIMFTSTPKSIPRCITAESTCPVQITIVYQGTGATMIGMVRWMHPHDCAQ